MAALCLMEGLATVASIPAAGLLWQVFGFRAAFLYGAAMSLLSVMLFVLLIKGNRSGASQR